MTAASRHPDGSSPSNSPSLPQLSPPSGDGSAALDEEFADTCAFVRNLSVSFSQQDYLSLYGLFKQAHNGDNDAHEPSPAQTKEHIKWQMWQKCRGLSRAEAKERYIALVRARCPQSVSPSSSHPSGSSNALIDSGPAHAVTVVAAVATETTREAPVRAAPAPTPRPSELFTAPPNAHPAMYGWVNHGVECYKEEYGEEAFIKYSRGQFDRPAPSHETRAALALALKKSVALFAAKAMANRERATHMSGVGGRGRIRIVDHPAFPEHEFFQASREFSCRIRHANAFFHDDRRVLARGCALKFADSDFASPLDLLMNTGAYQAFWSLDSFLDFVQARVTYLVRGTWDGQYDWNRRLPAAFIATCESARQCPSSYTKLIHNTAIPYPFKAADGKIRYAKYRLVPEGLTREEGLLPRETQRCAWHSDIMPKDKSLPRLWLKDDYRGRLRRGTIRYTLQIQLWDWRPGDTDDVFNNVLVWDQNQHPWLDLAHVSIEKPLSDDETAKMRMWVGNTQPSLGIIQAHSTRDFNSIGHARYHIYPFVQRARLRRKRDLLPPQPSEPLTAESADSPDVAAISAPTVSPPAGTRPDTDTVLELRINANAPTALPLDLRIVLEGEQGTSGPHRLAELEDAMSIVRHESQGQTKNQTDNVPNTAIEVELEVDDIGPIIAIRLQCQAAPDVQLFVHTVELMDPLQSTVQEFSCFAAIAGEALAFASDGVLPQHASQRARDLRSQALAAERTRYTWAQTDGLPSAADFARAQDVPGFYQFKNKNNSFFAAQMLSSEVEAPPFERLDDYRKMLPPSRIPRVARTGAWRDDGEFARQFLAGVHPNFLRRCRQYPSRFPAAGFEGALGDPEDLAKEIEDGRVFMADYSLLTDIGPHLLDGHYLAAPVVLLHRPAHDQRDDQRDDSTLMPIAIQLEDQGPVFTPNDFPNDWMLAKMWARLADTNVHQIVSHFLMTHSVPEAFCIAMHRQLSPAHPVYMLLYPHTKNTIAINTVARQVLLNPGGMIDTAMSIGGGQFELMRRAWARDSLATRMHFVADLAERGLDDAALLPHYPYRDDGMLLWHAISAYVADIVGCYYATDADVGADGELQAWIADLVDNGLPGCDLTRQFDSITQLRDLLTALIFNVTAVHSAMNFHQYEYLGFIPNCPSMLQEPWPSSRGQASGDTIMQTLPDQYVSRRIIGIVAALSAKHPEDVFLGQEPQRWLREPRAVRAHARFRDALEHATATIRARNRQRKVPFTLFDPNNVLNSTSL